MSEDPKPTLKLKTATPNPPIPPPGPTAPFPVGARLRYVGAQRLFAGYQMISILEPGQEVDIIEIAGAYSLFSVVVIGDRYTLTIGENNRAQWVPVAVS